MNPEDLLHAEAAALWPGFRRTIEHVALPEEPEILAELAEIKPGDTVLEVGSGTGRIVEPLSKRTRRIVAVDLLRQAARCTQEKGVAVAQASGFALPFRDEAFDCVVCNDVVHLIPTDRCEEWIRELVRVSRDRVLVGMVRNRLAFFIDVGQLLRSWKLGRLVEAAATNRWSWWFWRLKELIDRSGAKIVKVDAAARYVALFAKYPWYKRWYRVRPGRVGLFGWLLPPPYGLLQYDLLLVRGR